MTGSPYRPGELPEHPKPIDPRLLDADELVATLGREAPLEPADGQRIINWDTDEPSQHGIDGIERMRLIRDDIANRVHHLLAQLTTPAYPSPAYGRRADLNLSCPCMARTRQHADPQNPRQQRLSSHGQLSRR